MKLIHCSDIHLDSPLCSRLPGRLASERRCEIRSAFSTLLRESDARGVGIVMISGDLFDGAPSASALNFVLGEIAAHPNIEILYLPGNHDVACDRMIEDAALPSNMHVFGEGFSRRDYGEITVGAIRGNIDPRSIDLPTSKKNFLMLHGQIADSASAADSIVIRELGGRSIDYAALGHIHSYKSGKIDDRGIWCYSGCLAGRGFDECGGKGYMLLDTDTPDGRIAAEFIALDGRRFHDVELPLDGISDVHELRARAQEALSGIPSDDIARITLVGRREQGLSSYVEYLESAFRGLFAHFEAKDRSRLAISPSDYEGDVSVRGEFVRLVFADERLSDEERETVLSIGLRALDGERPER